MGSRPSIRSDLTNRSTLGDSFARCTAQRSTARSVVFLARRPASRLRHRYSVGTRPIRHSACRRCLMPKNRTPTARRRRKPTRRFPAEPLVLADVEALRAACSRRAPTGVRNRALLAILFRSGLRVSEALALFPKDLDPAGRSVRVLHGKGNKARTAPLPTDAADAIDRWLECRERLRLTGRHPLFCTLNGEPLRDSY